MPRKEPDRRLFAGHENIILHTLNGWAQDTGNRFESKPNVLHGFNEWGKMYCELETPDFVGGFELQQMPGCCAVLTMSYIRVHPETPENFDQVIQIVEDATYEAGFGSLVLTQCVPAYTKSTWKNQPWIKCLDRGWVSSDPFRNMKSNNLVVYLTKDMKQKPWNKKEME